MWNFYNTEQLYHHGILGMKWGRRRYQNKDGTLTNAGKRRKVKIEPHEDYKNAHSGKSVKAMSNDELRKTNDRLGMEERCSDLRRKQSKISKGTAYVAAGIGIATVAISAINKSEELIKAGQKVVNGLSSLTDKTKWL